MWKFASAALIAVLTVLGTPARAQDAPPEHHEKTRTNVQIRIPCRDYRRHDDGSWTLPGKLTVDETGLSYSDLSYTLEPPEDNVANILELRCGSGSGK